MSHDRTKKPDAPGSVDPGACAEQERAEQLLRAGLRRRAIQRKAEGQAQDPRAKIPTGAGRELASDVRSDMERNLGADLSSVRLHTGSDSARAAKDLGARAFTVGQDIHFAQGEFAPDTKEGTRLLAHELTHAVQGQQSGIQRKADSEVDLADRDQISDPADPAEKEADAVADRIADGGAREGKGAAIATSLGGVGRKPISLSAEPGRQPAAHGAQTRGANATTGRAQGSGDAGGAQAGAASGGEAGAADGHPALDASTLLEGPDVERAAEGAEADEAQALLTWLQHNTDLVRRWITEERMDYQTLLQRLRQEVHQVEAFPNEELVGVINRWAQPLGIHVPPPPGEPVPHHFLETVQSLVANGASLDGGGIHVGPASEGLNVSFRGVSVASNRGPIHRRAGVSWSGAANLSYEAGPVTLNGSFNLTDHSWDVSMFLRLGHALPPPEQVAEVVIATGQMLPQLASAVGDSLGDVSSPEHTLQFAGDVRRHAHGAVERMTSAIGSVFQTGGSGLSLTVAGAGDAKTNSLGSEGVGVSLNLTLSF